ncbi:hypothetical protein [Leuconostoc citreum]|uniref:hypothetical protein n=1 Tax=Leuconostoc citreum TaxID=33964 RepID=UPI0032DFD2DD
MFNFNKKSKIDAAYYARIEENGLDFDDDFIQSLAEQSGNLIQDWPNAKLSDLQSFFLNLTNDVVRASDRNLQVGNIVFYEKDAKGHDVPTGLSWENVVLTPEFENIAVSTADHVFNATSVRQDEETDYETIVSALQPLFDACLKETTLSENDLPELPSAQSYRKAQETGEILRIEAKKFAIATPVSEKDEPVTEQKEEASVPFDSHATIEPIVIPVQQPVPDISMAQNYHETKPEDKEVPLVSQYEDEQKVIDQIDLKASLFPVTESLKDVPVESENYIDARVNADKAKANNFLSETSLMYTQKVRKALSDHLKKSQAALAQNIKELRETDVLSVVDEKLASEREEEFTTRYDSQKKARKAGFDTDIKAESQRHETTIETLKNSYYRDLEELNVSINKELDDWYLKRSQYMQQSMQQSIDEDVKEQTQLSQDKLLTELKSLRDELLTQHSQSLIALQEQLSQDIEKKRLEHKREHDEAVIQATKLATAKSQAGHLSELEDQLFALKKQNGQLSSDFKETTQEKSQQIDTLKQEKKSLTTQNETLKRQLEEQIEAQKVTKIQQETLQNATPKQQDNDVNAQLLALLTSQMTSSKAEKTIAPKKGNGILTSLMVGAGCALVIGGTAFGAYSYGQSQNNAKAQVSQGGNAKQSSIVLGSNSSNQQSASSQESSNNSSSETSATNQQPATNPLEQRYHVGESVKATINGQDVTATVSGIDTNAITITYGNQSYKVPMNS